MNDYPHDDQSQPTDQHLIDAERAVIGAALLNADSVRFALEHVTPADFQDVILGRAFSLIVGLRGAGLPIDPISVHNAAKERISTDRAYKAIDGVYLHGLQAATPTASNVRYYATIVAEHAQRRRLAAFGSRCIQLSGPTENLTEVMSQVRDLWDGVRGSVASPLESKTLREVLDGSDEYDWLIPDLLERKDRLILTGGEGAGKSTFVRQLAILAAAGLNPVNFKPIDPVKVLVVDTENSEQQWRRKARPLAEKAARLGSLDPRDALELSCTSRMDITTDKDLGAVHRLIDEHKPGILVIGPLYRLTPRAINNDDDAAPLITALDSLRDRNVALIMEAHAGHSEASPGHRNLRPRGSAALMGWPEFGFGIAKDTTDLTERRYTLVRWRGERDERAWPQHLRRGGDWPWTDDAIPGNTGWTPSCPADRAA